MIIIVNIIALGLLGFALRLAYQAGASIQEAKNRDNPPPAGLFSLIATLTAFLILVFAQPACAERLVIEPGSAWSDGGYVRQYLRKRDSIDGADICSRCVSSCPIFLGHEGTCVCRKANLGFHALSYRGRIASPEIQENYATYLGSPALGQWFLNGPAKARRPIVYLSGDVVIDLYGFRECGGQGQ